MSKRSTPTREAVPGAPRRGGYPRPDRTGLARFVPSVRHVVALMLIAVLAVLGLSGFAYATVSVPSANEFASAQTSIVYYADGKTEMGRFSAQNRMVIPASEIPQSMKDATVAAEDRSFYENRGISPRGIARALWSNLRGDSTQGGSTITQQYVKNYYLDSDRTYTRKVKEAVLALKIDQQQSKDQILANYLNTIYFGRGAYGIQTAAQAYFAKDAQDLSPQESALLAGIIPNPTNWDPAANPDKAQARFDYVADGLVKADKLSQADRATWQLPEAPVQEKAANVYAGPTGYLLAQARRELIANKIPEAELDGGGLRIVTTIDEAAQQAAVATMEDPSVFPARGRPENLRASLVSIDPSSGAITAMYGGADYLVRQQNAASQGIVQAGSTFKPFTLVAGLESGISLKSTFNGANGIKFKGASKPVQNFGGASYGYVNLLTATADSVNTAYVGLNQKVGPAKTVDVATRAGLPADTSGLSDNLGNVLGTASPHPLDMANAFATFAAQGERHTAHIVQTATRPSGEVAYTGPTTGTRVFDEAVMADTTYALRQVVIEGSGRPASGLGRQAAGKTGTSSDNLSAWFVGYTPQLATAVTLYNTDAAGNPVPIGSFGGRDEVTGGSFPVQMWTEYMREALRGEPRKSFPDPAFGGKTTGRAASSSTDTSTSSGNATSRRQPSATSTRGTTGSPTPRPTGRPPGDQSPGAAGGNATPNNGNGAGQNGAGQNGERQNGAGQGAGDGVANQNGTP